jgi:CubicO group peptidase (beta-lactamase class C family)
MGYRIFCWAVVLCCFAGGVRAQVMPRLPDVRDFADRLDSIKNSLKIPAMAAAVMVGDSVLLEKGFGVPANAVFRVASITKTFTSTLVMQLVEKGMLNLDSPVSRYGVDLGNPAITVRNLLTHTSEEVPGSWYSYNGSRFGQLGPIIAKVTGKPFYQVLMENIVKPLNMYCTAPGDSLTHYFDYIKAHPGMFNFFETAHARLVRPYGLDEKGKVVEVTYPDQFGAYGELATTVGDLLKYSAAIDRHQFVSESTQKEIFTANRTTGGVLTPYGLGWFVQNYQGVDYYWHYGQSVGESGLFVKVPSKKLTVVVLANTEMLSTPFPLGDGDLMTSPVGQLIYMDFIGREPSDMVNKAWISRAAMDFVDGDTAGAGKLYEEYRHANFDGKPAIPPAGDVIAEIKDVPVRRDTGQAFTLRSKTKLRVYGVGEDCSGDHRSWCDYGWIEDAAGKVVWQMPGQAVQPAGGAAKNQRVDVVIQLPAGRYQLRYKSDWGHAYGNWDSLPPNQLYWGIVVYKQ